jgi:hypothetical protein
MCPTPIRVEVHLLVDGRVIPESDEAALADRSTGFHFGGPWRRRCVKCPPGALFDLFEIRVR